MRLTVTYYLDVISSWCFFTEPAWAELKKRYEGISVEDRAARQDRAANFA